jgi:phosphatidate cytidylyltransferase
VLATRVLTAAVLIAALLAALLFLDARAFAALVALLIALAGREWGRLARLGPLAASAYGIGIALAFAALSPLAPQLGIGVAPGAATGMATAALALAALFWFVIAPLWLRRGVKPVAPLLLCAAGCVVLIPTALAVSALPRLQLLLVLGLVWIADSAAYFAGRRFGRHKLAPSISPGKTWEGAAGGVVGAALYAIICLALVPAWSGLPLIPHALLFIAGAIVLCLLSIVGDLLESAVKRQAGVKDSGALLPGHGGLLDRIDSTTAVLPVAALALQLSGLAG